MANSISANNFSDDMKGSTINRPDVNKFWFGPWFDMDLNKPIWWNGKNWIDARGNIV